MSEWDLRILTEHFLPVQECALILPHHPCFIIAKMSGLFTTQRALLLVQQYTVEPVLFLTRNWSAFHPYFQIFWPSITSERSPRQALLSTILSTSSVRANIHTAYSLTSTESSANWTAVLVILAYSSRERFWCSLCVSIAAAAISSDVLLNQRVLPVFMRHHVNLWSRLVTILESRGNCGVLR